MSSPRKIKAPPEFRELVHGFFSESLELATGDFDSSQDAYTLELQKRWIAWTLKRFSDQKKQIIKEFLKRIFAWNPKPTEEELQQLWHSSGSSYVLIGKRGHEAMRSFLTEIMDQIR
jgi:hypothetical protein